MARELEVDLADGRVLHVYDAAAPAGPSVYWHHGSPQTGLVAGPLIEAAERLGVRVVSHDRPGYGGSSPAPGRDIAAVAADVAAVADALDIDRFAVLGLSGGGPHALACAALLPERVTAACTVAGIAPYDAVGLDWYAGMGSANVAELRAAAGGRDRLATHLRGGLELDTDSFAPADLEALASPYGEWMADSAAGAFATGPDGYLDDGLAFVAPWGFDVASIAPPVLVVNGRADHFVPPAHAEWLAMHCPRSSLRLEEGEGHLSIIRHGEALLRWLLETSRDASGPSEI